MLPGSGNGNFNSSNNTTAKLLNMMELNQLHAIPPRCHTRESGYPVAFSQLNLKWIPVFAGMTKNVSLS
jgi:hypothetical protein